VTTPQTEIPKSQARTSRLLEQPWGLWWLQGLRLTRIEVKRNLFSWKAGWVYFLAFIPAVIVLIHAVTDRPSQNGVSINGDTEVLAGIVQIYYVRLAIFFGCLGIYSRLIRGEMMERSLHFYLLAPVRREILLLAKFAAGSISSLLLFLSAMTLSFVFMYLPYGAAGHDFVFNGPGLSQLEAYLAIVVLACLGYGAIFLLLSMVFRNPAPAALIFLGWETISPVLPSMLQKLSVISYLRHLMPVTVPAEGVFALLTVETEPIPGWAAALGLLALIAVVLTYSCYRIRRLEIRYTTE
jgi:ABC-type transport system involved in multi-copper enzyme maturation permease subunit